jgi:putative endopeptidase
VSFGQMWRELHRTESLINQLRTGSHSPGRYRVNGPLANFKPFAEAFACKTGDGFVRPESEMITIW